MASDISKHLDRAKRFLEKNRVEDAIEAYLAVLEEAPQHQEATQALGDLYARMEQPDRAAVYYGMLFDLLVEMYDRKEAIDLITVQQRLQDRNQLEAVGGLTYLSSLMDAVPSAANLTYYLDIVREKHLLRRMIQTCSDVVGRVFHALGLSRTSGKSSGRVVGIGLNWIALIVLALWDIFAFVRLAFV